MNEWHWKKTTIVKMNETKITMKNKWWNQKQIKKKNNEQEQINKGDKKNEKSVRNKQRMNAIYKF